MPSSTRRKRQNKKKRSTQKNHASSSNILAFQKEVTIRFLEFLVMIKLFHWKTHDYSAHKASDWLHAKLSTSIDSFIETLIGKSNSRTDLLSEKTLQLIDLSSENQLHNKIDDFKAFLVSMTNLSFLSSDLINIRDTMLQDIHQFEYLLSLR